MNLLNAFTIVTSNNSRSSLKYSGKIEGDFFCKF